MVTPESMAGVSEKMVSVATASFLYGMLMAGNLDFQMFSHGESSRYYSPLCGIFKGFLDGISIDPTKVWC